MTPAVLDAWRLAYLANRSRSYANPIPDSIAVLAELRRLGYVASQHDVIDACRSICLPLADMPHTPRAREVPPVVHLPDRRDDE